MNDLTTGKDIILSKQPSLFDDDIPPGSNNSLNNSLDINEKIIYNARMREENLLHQILESPELQRKLEYILSQKSVMKNYERIYEISKINLEKEINSFLDRFSSPHTKSTYELAILDFISFCDNRGESPLTINDDTVSHYKLHLFDEGKSNGTIRTKLLSLNSFYKFLSRNHSEIKNCFENVKLPPPIEKKEKDVVIPNDLVELRKVLKEKGRKDILTILDLIENHGFRIGFLYKCKIEENGKFSQYEMKKIRETKCLEIKPTAISSIIKEYTKHLYKKELISCPFSIHDIRSFKMTHDLNECNGDLEKMKRVSKKYHKHFSTTLDYYYRVKDDDNGDKLN